MRNLLLVLTLFAGTILGAESSSGGNDNETTVIHRAESSSDGNGNETIGTILGAESSSGGNDNETTGIHRAESSSDGNGNETIGLISQPLVGKRSSSGTCNDLVGTGGAETLKEARGCPAKIPIIHSGKILAGRFYRDEGNDLPQLACNGICWNMYAETKYTKGSPWFLSLGSIIVNPGCTMYVFKEYDQKGTATPYTGLIPKTPKTSSGPFFGCTVPCIRSFLWTCKQTYPSCIPSDGWQTVTTLDNTASSIPTTFTYEKTVGTIFSQEMKDSMSVSNEVSVAIKAEFFGVTISAGMTSTTGYEWSTTDTETQSTAQTYTVQVVVPKGKKIRIEEAVGTCGGSKIYTQMFRVIEPTSGTEMAKYNGKIQNYIVSDEHTAECLKEDNTDYFGFDIANKRVSGLAECTNWCREISTCKYWTLKKSDNRCYLKTLDSGKTPNGRTISGSRNC